MKQETEEIIKYQETINQVAKHLGKTTRTIRDWALKGYPCGGKRIKLEGARKTGGDWRFNLNAVVKFIENPQCHLPNANTEPRMENLRPLPTGRMNSRLMDGDSQAQLADLISRQKQRQRRRSKS